MSKTLYHKTSKGGIQLWKIWTEGDTIFTEYGLLDGKKQLAEKKAKGKNIGKANETSPEEQAVLEMESMYKKKMDKGYYPSIEEAQTTVPLRPMLAKDWFKHSQKYSDDSILFLQPKLDGLRCLAHWNGSNIKLISRGNKEYNVPHVIEQLEAFCREYHPEEIIFDGELYNHDMTFNEISGAVKKIQESTERIEYHIYDLVDEENIFYDRNVKLAHLHMQMNPKCRCDFSHLHFVETYKQIATQFEQDHIAYVHNGYEGMIIRDPQLPYKIGYRSDKLLKYKQFEDAEFKVVDFTNGVGKFKDMVVFTCLMDDGSENTFQVVPKGTEQERKQYLEDGPTYIGRVLTVQYFGRSEDGIPRFPVGKGFRPVKDMS